MTKKLFFAGMILLVVTMAVMAADTVTGKWIYEQAGRNGGAPRQTTFDLKAAGSTLTGSVLAPAGGGRGGDAAAPAPAPAPVEIKNGKVDGDKISFDVVRTSPNGEMTTKYQGVVAGDELKLTMDMGRGPQEVVAKRAK